MRGPVFLPRVASPGSSAMTWRQQDAQLLSQLLCEGYILFYYSPCAQALQMLPLLFWPQIYQMNANS